MLERNTAAFTMGVLVLYATQSCSSFHLDDHDDVPSDSVLAITATPPSIPADGASHTTLRIRIPKGADTRTVALSTSAGSFMGGTDGEVEVDVGKSGVTHVRLQGSTQVDTAYVIAEVGGVVRERAIAFERAPPERIVVDPGTFELEASWTATTTVTATLLRERGTPTVGTEVDLFVVAGSDSTGERLGRFRSQTTSDARGVVTAVLSVGDTPYQGVATLFARAPSSNVVGSQELRIVPSE